MYVAIDIGASSGRVILSKLQDDRIKYEEVHRFKNEIIYDDNHYRWDIDNLLDEILLGLEKVKKMGIEEVKLGIDTWAVDYCVVSKDGTTKNMPISYRDARTESVFQNFENKMPFYELYERTGIQIQKFNTIFQLMAESDIDDEDVVMLIPDYISYKLTGNKVCEITNASTTQLLNGKTKYWDEKLLQLAKVKVRNFAPLVEPGYFIGDLLYCEFEQYDLPKTKVFAVASHDTASAVVSIPNVVDSYAYISSGTWSLLGIESKTPIINEHSYASNYTNEYGVNNSIRFLKNIMGMWLLERCLEEYTSYISYEDLITASKLSKCESIVDPNHETFINPVNMTQAIRDYCVNTQQDVPNSIGDLAKLIFNSLAESYKNELNQLQKITGVEIEALHIVGGGSKNHYLNQLTANKTKVNVFSGPSEATAIGNIVMLMLSNNEIKTYEEAKKIIRKTFEIKEYKAEGEENEV